jgi:hypothetical protein
MLCRAGFGVADFHFLEQGKDEDLLAENAAQVLLMINSFLQLMLAKGLCIIPEYQDYLDENQENLEGEPFFFLF